MKIFEPKLLTVIKEGYSLAVFGKDLVAGVIVGIVSLPLAIAFAIASGLRPEQGLYTAVIAGFLVSALGGSRVQIGGPTGAFIVIVYNIVQNYGYDGLVLATLMAGFILIFIGVARMGNVIKYIPYPVTVGFTSGIALLIFVTQLRDLFGLPVTDLPGEFVDKCVVILQALSSMNLHAAAIGAMTVFIIIIWPKVTHKIPGSLVAIIVTTVLVQGFHIPVETVGSRFGGVPTSLPVPHLPAINLQMIHGLIPAATAIALLAGIESLLSAVVADGMTGFRHRSNMELIAQGVANIASSIFGGMPATGAIARTATNIKNGGRTPVAGIVHALTLLLILIFLGELAALIPMPTLAGILVIVAYSMSEWRMFRKILHSPRSDVLVLLTTFSLTVFIDLTVAIEVGMVLAAFLFMRRMIAVTEVGYITKSLLDENGEAEDGEMMVSQPVPAGVEIFEINGPFFFGAADKFKDTLQTVSGTPKVLILRMRHVPAVDVTGLRALEDVYEKTKKEGIVLILSGVRPQPMKMLRNMGFIDLIGCDRVAINIDEALGKAKGEIERMKAGK